MLFERVAVYDARAFYPERRVARSRLTLDAGRLQE